jgi:hypothetical protein
MTLRIVFGFPDCSISYDVGSSCSHVVHRRIKPVRMHRPYLTALEAEDTLQYSLIRSIARGNKVGDILWYIVVPKSKVEYATVHFLPGAVLEYIFVW